MERLVTEIGLFRVSTQPTGEMCGVIDKVFIGAPPFTTGLKLIGEPKHEGYIQVLHSNTETEAALVHESTVATVRALIEKGAL